MERTMGNEPRNYTYMVRCRDGSLYTGWTNHLKERIRAHNEGRGAKYTRSRGPVELVYWEEFETKQEAMSREVKIKRLTRQQKESLIEEHRSRTTLSEETASEETALEETASEDTVSAETVSEETDTKRDKEKKK